MKELREEPEIVLLSLFMLKSLGQLLEESVVRQWVVPRRNRTRNQWLFIIQ